MLGNTIGPVIQQIKTQVVKLAPPRNWQNQVVTSDTFQSTNFTQAFGINIYKFDVNGFAVTETTNKKIKITYTIDGTDPKTSVTKKEGTAGANVTGIGSQTLKTTNNNCNVSIKAYQSMVGYEDSDVVEIKIKLACVSDPIITATENADGSYKITMSGSTPTGSTILWTFTNRDPAINQTFTYRYPTNGITIPSKTNFTNDAGTLVSVDLNACNNTNLGNPASYNFRAMGKLLNYFPSNVVIHPTIILKVKPVTINVVKNSINDTFIEFSSPSTVEKYHYTTNSSEPTTSSTSTTKSFTYTSIAPFTLKVKGFKCGWNLSDTTELYIEPIKPKAPQPTILISLSSSTISPPNPRNNQDQFLIINSGQIRTHTNAICMSSPDINDYDIYYTVDGSTPTTSSNIYSSCFSPYPNLLPFPTSGGGTLTIKAFSKRKVKETNDQYWDNSDITTKTVTVYKLATGTPTIVVTVNGITTDFTNSTYSGKYNYNSGFVGYEITLESVTFGSTIYYRTDPWANWSIYDPNNKPKVNATTTIWAYATNNNRVDSSISEGTYIGSLAKLGKPSISPSSGLVTANTKFQVSGSSSVTGGNPGANSTGQILLYRINGGDWIVYPTGGVTLTDTCTVEAIAVKDNYIDSDISDSRTYTVKKPFTGARCILQETAPGSSGTLTIPDDVSKLYVIVIAPGGNCDSSLTGFNTANGADGAPPGSSDYKGGGGGAWCLHNNYVVNPGQQITWQIGQYGQTKNAAATFSRFGTMTANPGGYGTSFSFGNGGTSSGGSNNFTGGNGGQTKLGAAPNVSYSSCPLCGGIGGGTSLANYQIANITGSGQNAIMNYLNSLKVCNITGNSPQILVVAIA